MATGLRAPSGVDLDTLFAAYSSGTKPALTGFRNASGIDLRDLFQPLGGGTKIADVGYRISSGVDISNLFAGVGGGSALAVGVTGSANGSTFIPEPAPGTTTVTTSSVTASATGGTGSYTYTWAYLSGNTNFTINGGSTGPSKSWSINLIKNTTASAVWRVTVNDGVNTATADVSVYAEYTTDL